MPIKTIQYQEFTLKIPAAQSHESLWKKLCDVGAVHDAIPDSEPYEARDALWSCRQNIFRQTEIVSKFAVVSPATFGQRTMWFDSFSRLVYERGFMDCPPDTAAHMCIQWASGLDISPNQFYTTLTDPVRVGGRAYWRAGSGNALLMLGIYFQKGKPVLSGMKYATEARGFGHSGIEENECIIVMCKD